MELSLLRNWALKSPNITNCSQQWSILFLVCLMWYLVLIIVRLEWFIRLSCGHNEWLRRFWYENMSSDSSCPAHAFKLIFSPQNSCCVWSDSYFCYFCLSIFTKVCKKNVQFYTQMHDIWPVFRWHYSVSPIHRVTGGYL